MRRELLRPITYRCRRGWRRRRNGHRRRRVRGRFRRRWLRGHGGTLRLHVVVPTRLAADHSRGHPHRFAPLCRLLPNRINFWSFRSQNLMRFGFGVPGHDSRQAHVSGQRRRCRWLQQRGQGLQRDERGDRDRRDFRRAGPPDSNSAHALSSLGARKLSPLALRRLRYVRLRCPGAGRRPSRRGCGRR